jgi:hypothetical protein
MSFNRLNSDSCAYKHQLNESIGPGEYMLDRTNICSPCFSPDPTVIMNGYGAALCTKDLIDVDSELIGITRKASDCPSKKYLPSDKPFCNATMPRDCVGLGAESCRISNPPCTLRCRGFNRWENLCQDPQKNCLVSFDTNINNRLIVKDTFRPCVPKPISQTLALPPHRQHQKELFCGIEREVHPLNYRTCSELRQY